MTLQDPFQENTPAGESSEQPSGNLSFVGRWNWMDVLLMTLATLVGVILAGVLQPGGQEGNGDGGLLAPVVIALAVQSLLMVGGVYVAGMLRRGYSWRDVGLTRTTWLWVILGAGAAFFLLPVRLLVGYALQLVIDPNMETVQQMNELLFPDVSLPGVLLIIVLGGLLVPFAEELFFRGVIFRWLRQHWGKWASILVSGAIFGVVHIYPPTIAAAFIIGVAMAWLYEKSESLWVPIVVHAVNNSFLFVMAYSAMKLLDQFNL